MANLWITRRLWTTTPCEMGAIRGLSGMGSRLLGASRLCAGRLRVPTQIRPADPSRVESRRSTVPTAQRCSAGTNGGFGTRAEGRTRPEAKTELTRKGETSRVPTDEVRTGHGRRNHEAAA